MEGKLLVPNNIEDPIVLKRFLQQVTEKLGANVFASGTSEQKAAALTNIIANSSTLQEFFDITATLNDVRTRITTYISNELETVVKQQKDDIAIVSEQFGTFYGQALAASWYGLTVKAGGAVAGLEVGSLDPDVTTPGDESSYFRVIADNFIVGRAYEDLSQEEKDYLAANNLPNFGTVYNAQGDPIPALIISWDSIAGTYKHYFNGIVQFSNVAGVPNYALTTYVDTVKSDLQNQIDGSITTWFSNGEPTLVNYPASDWSTNELKNQHLGDLYYDKTTGYAYRFAYEDIDDTPDLGIIYSWIKITDTDVTLALQKADNAQATADGKITTFYSSTTPTAEGVGDLWVNSTTDITYRWNGTTWVQVDFAKAVNNGTTTINGGKITTNTLEANRLKASIDGTTTWSGGALISDNFNGNAVGNIGAPTLGFRLSSNAEGTPDDPNIYGAYIKGSTIDIETLRVQSSYPGNSGRVIKFQTNGYIYMPNYGTGYNESRVCSKTTSFVKLEGWYRAATNALTAYLQYSVDGINWGNVSVKSAQQYGYQEYFYIYFSELFDLNLVADTAQVQFRVVGSVGGEASPILISIYNN